MKNIYDHLFGLLVEKKKVALATVIETEGSTPQVSGASALFSFEGLLTGTLGGGILEADAHRKAQYALNHRNSFLYEFSLEASISSEEGAICGGKTKILIDATPEKHENSFQSLHRSFSQRNAGLLATIIEKSSKGDVVLSRRWVERKEKFAADLEKPLSSFEREMKETFSKNKPALFEIKRKMEGAEENESYLFLEPFFPLPHLVIAGAGHIGRAVAHQGNLLNFEVTVIDDGPELANKENIPDADQIIVDEIGKAIREFPISQDTYLVIVTRGHQHDAEALRECIASEAAYIGMIGSDRKVKLMQKKFLEEGWATASQFDRVHAPIGVEIGSKTVEEIAVSIAAQLVHVRSQIQDNKRGLR
jgi:xanthine dehydrogenase accessory factor